MVKRLFAIGFIFCCTAIAWFILAGVTTSRTYSVDKTLRQQIERIWGAPQIQLPPTVTWSERVTRQVESVQDGKKVVNTVEDRVRHPLALQASDIVVLLAICVVRGIELHPMHFFFIAAAFFAFNLLFSYLVDHVSIHVAFALAAAVSLALVISYLRIVVGSRFASFAAGAAQLVYLVLFSYAFFFKGYTGLAVTIGAVATLFVLMQTTAKVNWNAVFADRARTALV